MLALQLTPNIDRYHVIKNVENRIANEMRIKWTSCNADHLQLQNVTLFVHAQKRRKPRALPAE